MTGAARRLAALALALAACAAPPAAPPLRVASDLDNRPFAWVDDGGTPGKHRDSSDDDGDVVWTVKRK